MFDWSASEEVKTIAWPSGDHFGDSAFIVLGVIWRRFLPSASTTNTADFRGVIGPPKSLSPGRQKTIFLPSGDQSGDNVSLVDVADVSSRTWPDARSNVAIPNEPSRLRWNTRFCPSFE